MRLQSALNYQFNILDRRHTDSVFWFAYLN